MTKREARRHAAWKAYGILNSAREAWEGLIPEDATPEDARRIEEAWDRIVLGLFDRAGSPERDAAR
jgi:hypothetical protein